MKDKRDNALEESSICITLEDKIKERNTHRKRIQDKERDKIRKIKIKNKNKNKDKNRKIAEYKREKKLKIFY